MININDLVEVRLKEPDDFKIIMETLSRIGVASRKENTLYQSCHILHKQGRYFIVHFKEMFLLDGKRSDFSEDDKARRNTITNLLAEWGLVDLVDAAKTQEPVAPLGQIKIISHKDKENWNLVAKYTIGKKREV
jgi:hypothetical protein